MKRLYKIMILAMPFFALVSCNNFLSLNPPHKLTIDNAVTSYDGAVSILNGMYASIATGAGTSNNDFFGGSPYVYLANQAGIAKAGGKVYYEQTYLSTSGVFSTCWTHLFGCVNAANAAIIGIGNLADNKFPNIRTKERMLAEARTFRAWTYAHLLWYFGHFWKEDECGVLWREELSTFSNIMVNRISVKESYEKIFADIDYSMDKLEDYTSAKKISKQLAQVLKAKLLLNRGWSGDYDTALTLVETILQTAPTSFAMNPNMIQMFVDSYDSKEVLFARYMEENSGRAYGEAAYSQTIIQSGDPWTANNQNNPSSLPSFYPEFNNWINADPRYAATMGWARAISATGTLYFCPTKLARQGRASSALMNDKFTTYYFRYPELYLMQAELRARTNKSLADCIAPINALRSKRTNPVLPQVPVPADKDRLMEIIFKEYCLELYMENGSEWFAGIRFKQPDGKPYLLRMKPDMESLDENKYCWPIPSTESSTNKEIKTNPGYDN